MPSEERQYLIVVFGATGVTGQLVARYLNTIAEIKGKWAVAGRNADKVHKRLAEVGITSSQDPSNEDQIPIIVADSNDTASLERMCAATKVIITLVGPYSRYGEALLKSAVDKGTHYCDLTGETPFVAKSIEKYHDLAKRNNAAIVHACGFDSIPSDLGTLLAVKQLKAQGAQAGQVSSAFEASGDVSGGTVDSLLCMLDNEKDRRIAANPYALSPIAGGKRVRPTFLTSTLINGKRTWGGFFIMGPFNSAIVRRTHGLLEGTDQEDVKYGPAFLYDENMVLPGPTSALLVSIVCIFAILVLATVSPARSLLRRFGPQPGSGFDDETLEKGWLRVTTTAVSTDGKKRAQIVTRGKGSPGYLATSKMISCCALTLALDSDKLPELGSRGGVLTPATAMGDALIQRLENGGVLSFDVVSDKKQ